MMLTREEKRQLLRYKLEMPNLSNVLADRYLNNEGNQCADYTIVNEYIKKFKEGRELSNEKL